MYEARWRLLAVWHQGNHLASLILSFLTFKMRLKAFTS